MITINLKYIVSKYNLSIVIHLYVYMNYYN